MNEKEPITTDGRKMGDYKTRYPDCKLKILRDATYVLVLMLGALLLLFLNFLGIIENADCLALTPEQKCIFHNVGYCMFAGLLGGATFGMKYLYRVVAHGFWSEDRLLWRIFAPLISLPLSLVMGVIMFNDISSSATMAIVVGFFTGYFSDEAVGKMYELAGVLFNRPDKPCNETTDKHKSKKNDKDSRNRSL